MWSYLIAFRGEQGVLVYTWTLCLQREMDISGPQSIPSQDGWMNCTSWRYVRLPGLEHEFGPLSSAIDTVSIQRQVREIPPQKQCCDFPNANDMVWGFGMCLASPLCKFGSRHSCKWLPVFVIHSPPLTRLPWMPSGALPPHQPGFAQLSGNCKNLFLGQTKMHWVCVLFTRTSTFVYVRGVFGAPI